MQPGDGSWQVVAASANVPAGVMRPFDVGSVVGFVRRVNGQPEAISGVCTHQGCRLWFDKHPTTGCDAPAIRHRSHRPARSSRTSLPESPETRNRGWKFASSTESIDVFGPRTPTNEPARV